MNNKFTLHIELLTEMNGRHESISLKRPGVKIRALKGHKILSIDDTSIDLEAPTDLFQPSNTTILEIVIDWQKWFISFNGTDIYVRDVNVITPDFSQIEGISDDDIAVAQQVFQKFI